MDKELRELIFELRHVLRNIKADDMFSMLFGNKKIIFAEYLLSQFFAKKASEEDLAQLDEDGFPLDIVQSRVNKSANKKMKYFKECIAAIPGDSFYLNFAKGEITAPPNIEDECSRGKKH